LATFSVIMVGCGDFVFSSFWAFLRFRGGLRPGGAIAIGAMSMAR
jgi:hypothetical protein